MKASAQYNIQLGRGYLRSDTSVGVDIDAQDIADRLHPNLGGGVAGPELVADHVSRKEVLVLAGAC
jgi:hypothetical protein